ncbi:GNAT family N-acetyltransferase [Streptomyces virginiae]|uniref:GNAT family N-acetyltransferase n=1 Tax=Streptomyces virginiae TaxID=1961 RepID=UPI003722DCD9
MTPPRRKSLVEVVHGATVSLRLSVPGAALVDTGGVTMASVAATHRRRRLMISMTRHRLDDVHERGEPLGGTGGAPGIGTDGVRLRYADPLSAPPADEAVSAAQVADRPGMHAGPPARVGAPGRADTPGRRPRRRLTAPACCRRAGRSDGRVHPADDAWQHLVSDVRWCERQLRGGLFGRPVDLGAAL